MEENEVILLKNSKKHIVRAGKWMGVFSIFLALGVLFLVVGGIFMLFVSGTMDEATEHYMDNVIGFGGIAVIIFAAALLPAIVCMRRAVRAANQVRVNNDFFPSVDFLRQTHYLWHYLQILIIVSFIVVLLASVAAIIVYWPQLSMIL